MAAQALVHVVDDDLSLREGLGSLLRSVGHEPRLYGAAREFLDKADLNAPGCIVLDIRLPGTSGLEFQAQMAELEIAMPVILMTGHGDIPMTVRGMKAGAVDFLPKPFRDQDLLDAVSTALAREERRRAGDEENAELRSRFASLSPRERQVIALVTAGKMNKQVAGELDLSEVTVKIHRGSAMRKMGAKTLPDLVRMVEALTSLGEMGKH